MALEERTLDLFGRPMRRLEDAGLSAATFTSPVTAPMGPQAVRDRAPADVDLLARLLRRGGVAAQNACGFAARLLARFGDMRQVMTADLAEVACLVGEGAARDLRLSFELALRVLEQPLRERDVLSSWDALRRYLKASLSGRTREAFHVLYLDGANRLIADERVGEGTVNHAPVYPREVVRRALEYGAQAFILVHNHPAGTPTPSKADIEVTKLVVAAAKTLGMAVHDHVLVAGEAVVSFRAQGLM